MITGKLCPHPENILSNFQYPSTNEEYWDNWYNDGTPFYRKKTPPPLFLENAVNDACAEALANGFHIGASVKRKISSSHAVGVILHFDKSEECWKPWSGRCEVLRVKFADSNSVINYHPEELELVKNETTQS